MNFVYNDGGREAAGYKGDAGDCVVRAIAIATDLPYQQVYDALSEGCRTQRMGKRQKGRAAGARDGVYTQRKWFKDYMASIGWCWTPTMGIGTGCKVHLVAEELPPGRLIVHTAKHSATVIDGVLHDIYDSSKPTHYLYPDQGQELKPGQWREGGGWIHQISQRCVYGYWRSEAAVKAVQEKREAACAAHQLAESLRPRKKTKRFPKPFTLLFRPGTFIGVESPDGIGRLD